MAYRVIWFLWSPLLAVSAIVLSLPVLFGLVIDEKVQYFLPSLALVYGLCALCWYGGRVHRRQMQLREGAWLMVLAWFFLSFIGMLPYGLSGILSWLDGWFESVATVTTTGLVTQMEIYQHAPRVFVLWRSALAWVGGMQFLALTVTVLPLLSPSLTLAVQGRQNISFSPMVHPMLGRAAKVIGVYAGITVLSFVLYAVVENNLFLAVAQAGLTVSTTGGIGIVPFDSLYWEAASLLPLFLVCTNFLLYLKVWERRSIKVLFADAEWQVMTVIIVVCALLVGWHLWYSGTYTGVRSAMHGIFQILSFISTGGLMADSIRHWPALDRCILFLLSFVGASLASLSGGLRVMRLIVLAKMAKEELNRTIHPHMVVSFTVNGRAVETNIVSFVLAYFFLFMMTYFVSAIILALAGITPLQALGLAIGCLSSVGSTATVFGITDFLTLPAWLKIYSTVLMIVGRMEIFAVCILLKTVWQSAQRPW